MVSFPSRLVRCFLVGLLALPLLAGNAAERRAGDCQPPNTYVLRATGDFLALLAAAPAIVPAGHAAYYPTLPVDPLDAVIVGRLQAVQGSTDWTDLQETLAEFFSKGMVTHMEAVPSGGAAAAAGPAAAANYPPWLRYLTQRLQLNPRERVGWVHMEDPLHANSVSRFHCLIAVDEPLSVSSTSGQSGRKWWIQDLGSLNGVYLNNLKIPAGSTVPLHPGDRVRFAPLTKLARAYLDRIRVAAQLGQAPNFSGLEPLKARELHMEYEFVAASQEESLAARETWLNRVSQRAGSGAAQPRAQAPAPQPGPSEVPAVAAASAQPAPAPALPASAFALPAPPLGGVPMDVVAAEDWVEVSPDMAKMSIAKPPAPPLVVPKALSCGLCRELMVAPVVLGCGDSFCQDCIQAWLREHSDRGCPLCHLPHQGPTVTSFILWQAIDAYEHQFDPAARAARAERVAQHRARMQVPGSAGEVK